VRSVVGARQTHRRRARKAAAGQAWALKARRPPLCGGSPAMLALRGRPRKLALARARRSCGAPLCSELEQSAADPPPQGGGQPSKGCASRRRTFAPRPAHPQPCRHHRDVRLEAKLGASAKPGAGVRRQRHMRRRGAQDSWPRASARFVHLTRRDCSSVANTVSVASFSAGHEAEHRREPSAQRRAAASERRRAPARGFAALDTSMPACGNLTNRSPVK